MIHSDFSIFINCRQDAGVTSIGQDAHATAPVYRGEPAHFVRKMVLWIIVLVLSCFGKGSKKILRKIKIAR